MKRVVADKIASVAQSCGLTPELRLSEDIPCEEGVVLSANDPVAAWGGTTLLRERFGIEPSVVTGPATDNAVGVEIIERELSVRAVNARTASNLLGDIVQQQFETKAMVG